MTKELSANEGNDLTEFPRRLYRSLYELFH